jgi:hypothetical protein
MRRSHVRRRGPIDFTIWGAVLGTVVGLASVPDHFGLRGMGEFIGVYTVGGGLLGLILGLILVAVRSGSGES